MLKSDAIGDAPRTNGSYLAEGDFGPLNQPTKTISPIADNKMTFFGEKSGVEGLPNFASHDLLESHFIKHGGEFKGAFNSPDEYLSGAHDVMNNGIKVEYNYKGETRTGYVRFAGTSKQKPIIFDIKKSGVAKFEFVGTNKAGDITTFHIESGKDFWKTINGLSSNKNITPYEYLYPEEEFNPSFIP